MKFALALISLAAGVSFNDYCALAPTQDVETYVVMETNDTGGYPGRERVEVLNALMAVNEWLTDNGFTFYASYDRASVLDNARCHSQYLVRATGDDLSELVELMNAGSFWGILADRDSTVIPTVVWISQYLWHEQAPPSLRRLYVLMAALYPGQPMTSDLTFPVSEANPAAAIKDNCPLAGLPPTSQVARAVKSTGAGLFMFFHPSRFTSDAQRQAWDLYFRDMGLTDYKVVAEDAKTTETQVRQENLHKGFFGMICPTHSTTTSAPPATAASQYMECAAVIDRCSPLWKSALIECLMQFTD